MFNVLVDLSANEVFLGVVHYKWFSTSLC